MFKREPLHEPLSDHLRQLRERGDGFRLPDNYLEELKKRAPATADSVDKVRPLRSRPQVAWLAMAASVALLLTLGWAWLQRPATPQLAEVTSVEANLDVLSDEDILAYVEDNIGEFELSLLYTEEEQETENTAETLTDEELDELYYDLLEE
jgi:hypothetical protein